MEIKKLVEELELVNDINIMSIKDLETKYLESEEKYKEFLNNYTDYFQRNILYQLRVYPHYKKILELVDAGHKKYENVNNNKKLLEIMDYNTDKYKLNRNSDDEIQAKFLLFETIGKNKTKGNANYESVVEGIYNSALNYGKKDVEVDGIMDYLYFVMGFNDSKHYKELYEDFSSRHPFTNELNNINFLYFANYLINSKPSIVTEDFIDDVKKIISASIDIEKVGMSRNKNFDDYKKVANFTLKSIKKLEKREAKVLKK